MVAGAEGLVVRLAADLPLLESIALPIAEWALWPCFGQ